MQIDLLFLFSCTNSALFLVPSCTNVAQFVIPSPNTNAAWSGLFMYKCGLICHSSSITNAAQFIHPSFTNIACLLIITFTNPTLFVVPCHVQIFIHPHLNKILPVCSITKAAWFDTDLYIPT